MHTVAGLYKTATRRDDDDGMDAVLVCICPLFEGCGCPLEEREHARYRGALYVCNLLRASARESFIPFGTGAPQRDPPPMLSHVNQHPASGVTRTRSRWSRVCIWVLCCCAVCYVYGCYTRVRYGTLHIPLLYPFILLYVCVCVYYARFGCVCARQSRRVCYKHS